MNIAIIAYKTNNENLSLWIKHHRQLVGSNVYIKSTKEEADDFLEKLKTIYDFIFILKSNEFIGLYRNGYINANKQSFNKYLKSIKNNKELNYIRDNFLIDPIDLSTLYIDTSNTSISYFLNTNVNNKDKAFDSKIIKLTIQNVINKDLDSIKSNILGK